MFFLVHRSDGISESYEVTSTGTATLISYF